MQECKESEIFDFLEKTECNAMDHYEKPIASYLLSYFSSYAPVMSFLLHFAICNLSVHKR